VVERLPVSPNTRILGGRTVPDFGESRNHCVSGGTEFRTLVTPSSFRLLILCGKLLSLIGRKPRALP